MSRYAQGGLEPSLEEMLDDPVVQAVMERDGVTDQGVRDSLAHLKGYANPHPDEGSRSQRTRRR